MICEQHMPLTENWKGPHLDVVQHNPDHVAAHGQHSNVPPAGSVVRLQLLSRHLVKLDD